ncbi:alkylated DNA repair protein ALKBH8 homolog isoform X2 [Dioscorea cayenensis subsp. rotundata]|uniref:Alkylated DNA repair protein ALKBH8 homolog isoform X2 n=1 Tax=Dioscorea cayennensis subsp. rotundata TaxID=55577 RepID=A0AB40CQY7_DIOCR|nr:alkylated DNA repair protein ALKBH8 homolog isoform X2 [Dioscorea cayenensis subsp. rotundata]
MAAAAAEEAANSMFARPKCSTTTSPNLYVANCGPTVGLSLETISSVFSAFGRVTGVHAADDTGARVIVCFSDTTAAQAAYQALNGNPCPQLRGRTLRMRFSLPKLPAKVQDNDSLSVFLLASELAIPGIYLVHDFITPEEEEVLLAAVDASPWKSLAKRRVQHYGYEFLYETRNVDARQYLGNLPSFVSFVLDKISSFPEPANNKCRLMDQLTVNEYPSGVGLSPHIDTHSAFDELIFSLSISGPCIMEFRKYPQGTWYPPGDTVADMEGVNFIRKAIFLPPRSMLLMSGEGRYAWHHYIPHHKVDVVKGQSIKRSSRRVSFTFRKVRRGPCRCEFQQCCDSRRGSNVERSCPPLETSQ